MAFPLEVRRAAVSRYLEGERSRAISLDLGVSQESINAWTRGERMGGPRQGYMPNDALRRAFEESGLTLGEVARRVGWMRRRKSGGLVGDGTRVGRMLGVRPEGGRRADGRHRETITYENAVTLARVIGVDPVDVGL